MEKAKWADSKTQRLEENKSELKRQLGRIYIARQNHFTSEGGTVIVSIYDRSITIILRIISAQINILKRIAGLYLVYGGGGARKNLELGRFLTKK
jgi:hypothetical protein